MIGDKISVKVMLSNTQGYISKKASIDKIVATKLPDVYCINETALKGQRKIKVQNYFSFCKNREKHMGGVATLVASYLRPNTVKVAEGRENDEYIITRLDNVTPPINIVNIYGEQEKGDEESDKRTKILESWKRLLEDIDEIEKRQEHVLLIGDMNRALGAGDWGVKGNKPFVSFGGQLLRDMFSSQKYILLNNLPLAEGGPWTWVDRSNSNVKSCLDLGIVSAGLLPFVTTFQVDSQQEFTPKRVRKIKNGLKYTFSDHYSIEVVLSNLPRASKVKEPEQEICTWNLKKEGGWERFSKLTEANKDKVDDVVSDKTTTIEEKMKMFNTIDRKVKFQSFGKTRKTSGKTN